MSGTLNEACPPIPPQYQFVLLGSGRSATKNMAHMLTRVGLPVAHEKVFSPYAEWSAAGYEQIRVSGRILDTPIKPYGESSWMATPFLKTIKKKRPDIQLVGMWRNPVDIFNSLVGMPLNPETSFGAFYDFHWGLPDWYSEPYLREHWGEDELTMHLSVVAVERINWMYGAISDEAHSHFQVESFLPKAIYGVPPEMDPMTHEWLYAEDRDLREDHWYKHVWKPFVKALGPCAYFCKYTHGTTLEARPESFGSHRYVHHPDIARDVILTPWEQSFNFKRRFNAETIEHVYEAAGDLLSDTAQAQFQAHCDRWEALTMPEFDGTVGVGESN